MQLIKEDKLRTLLVGPTLWSAYFIFVYVVSGIGCARESNEAAFLGINPIQLLTLAAALPITGLLVLAARRSHRRRRRLLASQAPEDARQRGASLYAISGLLSLLSLVGIVWLALNAVMAPVC